MSELDKLESYLKSNDCHYVRIDENRPVPRHQIIVFDDYGDRAWDAICHRGSYGYEEGLLEIMGSIVDVEQDGDSVVGWLTAEAVINRLVKEEMKREGLLVCDLLHRGLPDRDDRSR